MIEIEATVIVGGLTFPESPRWRGDRLWFSDIRGHAVCTVDEQGHVDKIVEVPQQPSGLGWLPNGTLLIVSMIDRKLMRLDGHRLETYADLSGLAVGNMNDMVVDAAGRAYVGSIGRDAERRPAPTRIVLVTPSGEVRSACEGRDFPNGSVITPDGRRLIVAESFRKQLVSFQIAEDGALVAPSIFAEFEQIMPDGICQDAEGAIWIGTGMSGAAPIDPNLCLRVRQGGEILETVQAQHRVIACMLGGADGRTLFLCTGRRNEGGTGMAEGFIEVARVSVPHGGLP